MKRRTFLTQSSAMFGSSWITLSMPVILASAGVACKAKEEASAFRVLSVAEAAEFEAIAAQIIPSGDTPGAREAGVIYFIDTVLADIDPDMLEPLQTGLLSLQADIGDTHGATSFAGMQSSQQIEALKAIEETDFFETMRFLTIAGTFCNPSQGGNRDEVGWKLIGMERPGAAQPPFGFYDADYMKKGA